MQNKLPSTAVTFLFLAQFSFSQTTPGCGAPKEEEFFKSTVVNGLNEPMDVKFATDGRIFLIEKVTGKVLVHNPATNATTVAATLDVSTAGNHADGLLGLELDPNFTDNHWLYLYYSPTGKQAVNVISRFTLMGDKLDLGSEKKVLEVSTQRNHCCHSAGGLEFGPEGNLYLSTGDNSGVTSNVLQSEAEPTSGNTNDLRGKILRIHPEPNGTYTIPAGNLFPPGTAKTRSEIYTMGHRNPFRFSIDRQSGWIMAGEVGPDGADDFDEVNVIRSAGNQGWPYFVGDRAYPVNGTPNTLAAPVNLSAGNTGLQKLPPARVPALQYKYTGTPRFTGFDKGGRVACGGPRYHYDFASPSKVRLPPWFDGKWLMYDWAQRWIKLATLDSNGNFTSIENLFPKIVASQTELSRITNMKIGPDGAIYIVQYGWVAYGPSTTGALFKIEYHPPRPECLPGSAVSLVPIPHNRIHDDLLGLALQGKRFDLRGKLASDPGKAAIALFPKPERVPSSQ
jgi:cytochrome c